MTISYFTIEDVLSELKKRMSRSNCKKKRIVRVKQVTYRCRLALYVVMKLLLENYWVNSLLYHPEGSHDMGQVGNGYPLPLPKSISVVFE